MTEHDFGPINRLLEKLEAHPTILKLYFDLNPDKAEALKPVFNLILEPFEERYRYLEALYNLTLGPINPNGTALFLASGHGIELVAARKVIPNGRLIAIDKEVTGTSVTTEIVTNARFYEQDLSTWEPEDLTDLVGGVPNYLICRHPDVGRNPWLAPHLARWLPLLKKAGSKMLVTTFGQEERDEILDESVRISDMRPRTFEYADGAILEHPKYGVQREDKFVAVFG